MQLAIRYVTTCTFRWTCPSFPNSAPLVNGTATDAGLSYLDCVDWYINFCLLMIGLFESFGAGWVYGIEHQFERFGQGTTLAYMGGVFGTIVVSCFCWFMIDDADISTPTGFGILIGGYIVTHVGVFVMLGDRAEELGLSRMEALIELATRNVLDLRDELETVVGFVPSIWAMMMKHFIPQVLIVLFANLSNSTNGVGKKQFGHYGSYKMWPFQILGFLCVMLVGCLILLGIAAPDLFVGFDLGVDEDGNRVAIGSTPDVMKEDGSEPTKDKEDYVA